MSEFVEYTAPVWRGLDMRALKVDEAYLLLEQTYQQGKCFVYSLSEDCYTCPYERLSAVKAATTTTTLQALKVDVAYDLKFKFFDRDVGEYAQANETALCQIDASRFGGLAEFGVYNLTLLGNGSCSLIIDKPGVNTNLSILSVLVLVSLVLSVLKVSLCAWRTYRYDEEAVVAESSTALHRDTSSGDASGSKGAQQIKNRSNRLRSLDAFRGLAIVLMIFVNSGGGHYWWIEHATWNGLHLADIVFPSFLWIMGVCIPISVRVQLARGASKGQICRRIAWRAIKLFAIGLCLNSLSGPQLENLRIMGVLQRFGVAFFVCGIAHTIFRPTISADGRQSPNRSRWEVYTHDLLLLGWELLVLVALVVLHLSLVFGLPVPGDCPLGYLGPGGKDMQAAYPNCTGGVTGYVDSQLLGNAHIYQHPTARRVYASQAFDPEGLFGCLLTVVQVLLGLIAGMVILVHEPWQQRCARWLLWAVGLALLGGGLCAFSREGGVIPLNKNLWSLSFVCVTSSLAFALLTALYVLIDVLHWWTGFPFVEAGMNAIVMYVGHTVAHKMLPWHWRIGPMNTHFVLLLESVWNTLMWIAIALYLHAIKFYYSL